jgi:RNA polymerase sigma factor (TIGR02999 family)
MDDPEEQGAVTRLLNEWQHGDAESYAKISTIIHAELHRIAESYLRRFPNATLQPTELMNEAYIRLTGQNATYNGRQHFYALAAKVMRQLLVDRARARKAAKRGGGAAPESFEAVIAGEESRTEEFLMLDEVLTRLATEEPRLAQIVELRYFGGLTGVEIAGILDIPAWQVSREQRLAEAWLKRALSSG